jgi:monoamine oxidase
MAHTPLFRAFTRALQYARRANLAAAGLPEPVAQSRLNRRQFLAATLAGGAGLALNLRSALAHNSETSSSRPSIAIVGGGIAGLSAAYHFKQHGLDASVYEARGRLGGRIRSVANAIGPGLVTELGGEFINSDHADMLALAQAFELRLFNRAKDAARFKVPPVGYLFDGRSYSEEQVAQQLRPLAAQVAADAALLDEDWERYAPRFDRVTVAGYLDQHAKTIQAPFVRTLIENAIRTELGVESEQTSIIHLLFILPSVDGQAVEVLGESDELYTIEGGSSRLVERLADVLSNQVHTNHRLLKVAEQNGSYQLFFKNRATVEADYVILAMPFAVLRRVELAIALPQKLQRLINELDSGRNEKLIGGFTRKVWREQTFAAEAWTDLGFASAWDATQRQPRTDGGLTFFLGGQQVQATASMSARQQGGMLVGRLDELVPGVQAASNDQFLRTNWHKQLYSHGAYVTFKPGQYTQYGEFLYLESDDPAERQDVAVGNLLFAGEHLSDAFYGYMNGAAQTGRLAAETIIERVRSKETST